MENEYSGQLTGNPYLFYETKTIALFLLQKKALKDIIAEIGLNNLFHYRSPKSIPKRVNAICKRLEGLDQNILERLAKGSAQEGKIITLLAIALSDRLFREFLGEVLSTKMQRNQNRLTDGDIRRFFEAKAEVSLKVASFSVSTLKKLRQIYLNILLSVGILNNRQDPHVRSVLLEDEFRRLLSRSFPNELIQTIEGKS